MALYRTQGKNDEKPKFEKVKHAISKPTKPLCRPAFYENHWTDERLLRNSLESGKIIQGRLHFGRKQGQKHFGFVVPEPVWYKVPKEE